MPIKKSAAKPFKICLAVFLVFSFLFFSAAIAGEIRKGINICLSLIIPSLFCFMTLTSFLMKTGIADNMAAPLSGIISFLYKTPKEYTPIILLSLIGGYPVGTGLISSYAAEGRISQSQAQRLVCFCVNSGPSFLIGAVSIPLFGNIYTGLLIYLSHISASIAVANIIKNPGEAFDIPKLKPMGISEALVFSAGQAAKSMSVICSMIILFSALSAILSELGIYAGIQAAFSFWIPEEYVTAAINGILEVCRGCEGLKSLDGMGKALFASGITAFGGICVHMQIAAIAKGFKINFRLYFLSRLVYTAVSLITNFFLFKIFGGVESVFAPSYKTALSNGSPGHLSSLFLLALCILLLLSLEKSDIMKKNKAKDSAYGKKAVRKKHRTGM